MEKIGDNHQQLGSKIKGALLLGALGDALGVPTEMRKQRFLQEKYGIVNDFLPTKDNLFFDKKLLDSEKKGYYSDDTVLTFAILKSLTEIGGIDMEDIWKKQIEGYENRPYGFGRLTTTAFEKIQQGIPLKEITNPDGGGNGMMMKQFPLAAYFALKDASDEEDKLLLDITKVSHGYPAALVSAVVHHHLLKTLLQSDSKNLDKKQLMELLKNIAISEETKYPHREGKKISEVLSRLQECIENNTISLNDQQIFEKFGWGDTMKQAGFITVTLGIVYCLFLRDTSMQGVWDAVNFGGDTDTYASIIGNMAGALHGEIYDDTLLHGVQNIEELKQQVNDFIFKLLS